MAKSAKFRIGDRVPIKYYEQNTTAVIVGFVNSYYRVRIEAYKEYRSDKDAHRMKFGTLV